MILFRILLGCAALSRVAYAQKVFAHFMAQNSFSYSQQDWANDINTAVSIGIDGFALNMANFEMTYEPGKVDLAYAAAEALNGKFQFFYSFDMADLSHPWDPNVIVNQILAHANSVATYKWKGKILVSTFDGHQNNNDFWAGIKASTASQGVEIVLAPAFINFRPLDTVASLMSTYPAIDGFFNWWSWPDDVPQNLTTDLDVALQNAVKNANRGGPYIMGVSPWQFKDIDPQNNWVEFSDTLWNYRWQQAIQLKPDIVEIITWNDYGESHYIGDINPNVDLGQQAPNYVNGFVHAPWRIVANYYIQWYKTGSPPAVQNDQVVFWYRSHPKAVTCSGGFPVRNGNFPADAVIAWALLRDSATISLDIGSKHAQWDAGPGVSMGSVPFPPEDAQIPFIQIIKNGQTVSSGFGSIFVTNSCSWYNFNPFVGSIST